MVNAKKTLYRIPKKGQIFGVCAGLAEYFDIDVTLMRVIFVVAAFATGGAVILLYLILAVVLPVSNDNGKEQSVSERVHKLGQEFQNSKVASRTRNFFGFGLLVLGLWLLIGQIFPGWFELRWDFVWPVLIILAGLLIITRRGNGQ